MIVLLNVRNGHSGVLPRLKVKSGKRYKVRTPIELTRTADPQYSCGKELRGETIRQLYKQDRHVIQGERVDGIGNIRGYSASSNLPKVVERIGVRSKTYVDIAIDNTADVLVRILRHRGYQACDALAELCKEDQQRIVVDTTVYWVENGRTLQVHVGSIRVKKVTRTDSTRLLPEYFTKYLPMQLRSTWFQVEAPGGEKYRPAKDMQYDRIVQDVPANKEPYRLRYAKPITNYGFLLNGDDLRDLREKVRLARMTAGWKNIEH